MAFKDFEHINTAWEAAEQQRCQGDFVGAYDSYLQILSTLIFQGLPQWSHDAGAKIIQATADLSLLMGDFETADNLLGNLVYWYQSTENHPFANFTLLKRIHLELERGNFDRVHKLLQSLAPQIGNIENIDISPSGLIKWEQDCFWENSDVNDRSILFAHLYWAMGKLLSALGQYHDALVTLERGLWYTRTNAPSLARQIALPLHFNIASAYLEKGELDKALAKLSDLKTAFDPNSQPELKIRWLELMGKISLLRGQLGQALDQFRQVQEICRMLGLARAVLQSTLNLANVLISINQTSLAKDYLTGLLSEKLVQQDLEYKIRIDLLFQVAEARSQSLVSDIDGGASSVSKMYDGKTNYFNNAADSQSEDIIYFFKSSNYLALFEFRSLQFYWLLSRHELVLANQLLSGIQSAFELNLESCNGSDSKLIQIKIKILLGILAYYQGVESNKRDRLFWAASTLDKVRPDLEQMGLKPELWQVQRFLGWCWSRLEIRDLQIKVSDLNNNLLDELTGSLEAEDQAIYLLNKWTADEEYIAGKINCIQRLRQTNSILLKPLRYLQSIYRLHRLMLHIDRYKNALAKRTLQNHSQPLHDQSTYSLWERILRHPNDRITLTFLVLPDRVLIVRIGWLLFDYQIVATTRLELRNLVQGWHSRIQGFNRDFSYDGDHNHLNGTENDNRKISRRLSETLKINLLLKGLPKRIKSISIIPDDILHGFPFASALHENKYLIEEYAVSITYESHNINKPKSSSLFKKSLLVGISQGNSECSSLPNVKSEITKIEDWMNQHQLNPLSLINAAADKKTVIRELSQSELFHIACHGVFKHSQPELSGLVLITDYAQPAEILSLRELSYLDLSKLHHATLSSCWSADHFILPGRWIISLPETLWRSGTQSILGCLWEVDDFVAVSFMTRFYKNMEKYPRDKALQLTQKDCMEGKLIPTQDTSNPLYWSGFTLYGEYKKLEI